MTKHIFSAVAEEPHQLGDPGVIRRVFGALAKLPVVREIEEAVRANEIASRAEIGERIAALEERQHRELPPLANATVEAAVAFAAVEKQYLAARTRLANAAAAEQLLTMDLAHQIERAFVELEASADERINHAVAAIHEQIDQLTGIHLSETFELGRDWNGREIVASYTTNEPDLLARRRALLAARDLAISWKREVDPGDVEARLDALLATIPSGRELTEIKP